MGTWQQDTRKIGIEAAAEFDLTLISIIGEEAISETYCYQIELASSETNILAANIIGQRVSIWIQSENGNKRYLHGVINRFSAGGMKSNEYRSYQAHVVPHLWFLSKSSNCRIFQNLTAPQIIEEILTSYTIDYQLSITRDHNTLSYCVQYNETDLAFITRLLNEHGLFYFFRHQSAQHTLVLTDSVTGYEACDDYEVIQTSGGEIAAHIDSWSKESEFISGSFTQTDFNYESRTPLFERTSTSIIDLPGIDQHSQFNYPGRFSNSGDAESQTDLRMKQEEATYCVVQASSNYRSFFAGGKFMLKKHDFVHEAGNSYVITRLKIEASADNYHTEASGSTLYKNTFTAIPSSTLYFSQRSSNKPVVQGPQTAIVVGPESEKIYTDEFGRVKVQFHWDTQNQHDENSSCWLRVSQSWAGSGWGEVALPHVGNEVIVSFLNGDPDRPIITGRVYNASNMPPQTPNENSEKYILQDDYSNNIVLNASDNSQQIKLHSPIEDSKIEIGTIKAESDTESDQQGIRLITDGDIVTEVRGKNASITSGNGYSISAGTEFSLFGGAKLDVNGGAFGSITGALAYDCSFGGNHTVSAGYTNAWSLNAWINATNSDILNIAKEDVITGAGDEICFVANCNAAGDGGRAIYFADKDKISLSMGTQFEPKATGSHNEWYNPYGGPIEDIARLVGAGVAAGLAASAVAASEKRDNETLTAVLSTAAGLVFVATAASVIREWYVNNRDAAIEPIAHTADEEALKLELNTTDGISLKAKEKNILLTTGEPGDDSTIALGAGIGIKFGDVGIIAIDDKGKISITSDADISIESQSNIDLMAKKKVRAKGEAFDYNGVLKHKNFKVLS